MCRISVQKLSSILCVFWLLIKNGEVDSFCDEQLAVAGQSSSSNLTQAPEPDLDEEIRIIVGPSSVSGQSGQFGQNKRNLLVLPKSSNSFQFTCVSSQPVDWKYEGVAVSSPDLSIERGRNRNASCYYMTIRFPTASDEIIGVYTCYQLGRSWIQENVTLFAGNSHDGYLVLRKEGCKVQGQRGTTVLDLPCVTNQPDANVTLWNKINFQDNWTRTPPEYYTFDSLTGIHLSTKVFPSNLSHASFRCDTSFSRQDAAYFSYELPQDSLMKPASKLINLPRNASTLSLECYSMSPVSIQNMSSASSPFDSVITIRQSTQTLNLNSSSTSNLYGYSHGVKANLVLIYSDTTIIDGIELGNISCVQVKNGDILHTWSVRRSEDVFNPGLTFNPASSTATATCFSKSPSELRFYYVICVLMTKCKFLEPCLRDSPEWACPESARKNPRQTSSNETSITVELVDYSGALSCIGVDVNETIYFHRTGLGKLELDENQADLMDINVIGNSEIAFGNSANVECIASKRFFINRLSFELWSNGKFHSSIQQGSIITDENSNAAGGMFVHRVQFKLQDPDVDEIKCIAERYETNETSSKGASISVRSGSGFVNWTTITLALVAVIFLIIVIVLVYFWRSSKKKFLAAMATTKDTKLTDLEYELLVRFREGCPTQLSTVPKNLDTDTNSVGPASEDGHYYAQLVPYNTNQHEIPLDKLQIDRKQILGIGEYGIVYKGVYDNGTFGVPVAVKELKPNAQYVYLKALLAEIKIMIYVDKHENIVEFIGACTQRKLDACIVLRLYPYGTLEKYLRDHRLNFTYQNCASIHNVTNAGNSGYVNPTELCVVDLMKWSLHIANALEYLFQKKVIHGDLATRNVLLDETLTAKISDFGLARQRYEDLDFPKLCDMPLPWRWMSHESLRYLEFTQQSDLWSYGVTMWEIFSLAEIPYLGQRLSSSFLTDLENGVRLEKPTYADSYTDELYEIMTDCWKTNPKDRIPTCDIKEKLSKLISRASTASNMKSISINSQSVNYKQIDFSSTE